jgi:Ohr subfamily peroxiredoxin
MPVQPIYTTTVTSTGARAGHVESSDGRLKANLSAPRAMHGDDGPGTNPEQLFAAAYSACFASAAEFQAMLQELDPGAITVTGTVGVGPDGSGSFGIKVHLDVAIEKLNQAAAEKLAADAHAVCPYSKAVHGNVDVKITVKGLA